MKNSIIRKTTIKELDAFEQYLEWPLHEYQVYLSAIIFETTDIIKPRDVPVFTQHIYHKFDICGFFPPQPFSYVQKTIRDALSWTLVGGGDVDKVTTDEPFITRRERKFWQIIVQHFPLPPTFCFEYVPDDMGTPANRVPYFPRGTWWEFFFVLCHQNKGLILEGDAL